MSSDNTDGSSTSELPRAWHQISKSYTLQGVLGQGSYGTVMKGVCKSTGAVAAVGVAAAITDADVAALPSVTLGAQGATVVLIGR